MTDNFDNDINKKISMYKGIYMMAISDNFITLDSINRLMDKYLDCEKALQDGVEDAETFKKRKNYYRRVTLLHCFSQLKLLDKYISDIDIKKSLTAFEERELGVYLEKVAEIEKVLNKLEPNINIMEVIVRGV